jgi:glycosyltransferase involved in cell wall biosynthesis
MAKHCELDIVTTANVRPEAGVRVHNNLGPNDPELLELYRNADIFVFPTYADCLGVAIIEAMASGLPVIATTVGGQPEAVRDGRTGLIVPPGDSEALGRAIMRLITDTELRRSMSRQARTAAVEHYDLRTNSGRIVEVIQSGIDDWKGNHFARSTPYRARSPWR